MHNLPTPLLDAERPYQFHDIVSIVNKAQVKLKENEGHLFCLSGGRASSPTVVAMKLLITSFVDELISKVKRLPIVDMPWVKGTQAINAYARDALVNIGAGFLLAGSYFILLGSSTQDDCEAIAARFHLEKAFFEKHDTYCRDCGHKNCRKQFGYADAQCSPEEDNQEDEY